MIFLVQIILTILKYLGKFLWWFYSKFLPWVIVWIGIPLFILGLLMAIAFIGSWLLFLLIFIVFMLNVINHIY